MKVKMTCKKVDTMNYVVAFLGKTGQYAKSQWIYG